MTLTDVKINNDYEYYEATAPTATEKEPDYTDGERWIDTTTGYSYELQDQAAGTWNRIEKAEDNRFNYLSDDFWKTVLVYLSNSFKTGRGKPYTGNVKTSWTHGETAEFIGSKSVSSLWTFDSAGKTIAVGDDVYGDVDDIKAGDTVLVQGAPRNHGFFTVESVVSGVITVKEGIADETAEAFVSLAFIPTAICKIAGRMMHYDLYLRENPGFKSEKIGTYSYTMNDITVGGLRYPAGVAGDLDNYKGVSMGGESIYVN